MGNSPQLFPARIVYLFNKEIRNNNMKTITTGILLALSIAMADSETAKPHGYLFAAADQGEVLRLGGAAAESQNPDKSTSSRKATNAT